MSSMSSSHAEKLRCIRKAEGLTQAAFAKEVGLALSSVRNYETGHREVGLSIIDKVINHPRFEKYMMWLMSDKTSEAAGQVSPALSPDGSNNTSDRQQTKKVG
ncbi:MULTISPECIES: helix-turn-helix transcriptional regulator [Serratia]|uniref:helix-turn-helix transcriptional regulator n=1 Tax=Serratia TaxID=613 RepID=UPI0031BB0974